MYIRPYNPGNACNVCKRPFDDALHAATRGWKRCLSRLTSDTADLGRVRLGAFAPSLMSKDAGTDTRDGKRIYASSPGSHASQKDMRAPVSPERSGPGQGL